MVVLAAVVVVAAVVVIVVAAAAVVVVSASYSVQPQAICGHRLCDLVSQRLREDAGAWN